MSRTTPSKRAETERRFRPYPAYKGTGVAWLGEIPAHWELKRLKYSVRLDPAASEIRGLPPSTEVSFVPMEDVGEYGGMGASRIKALSEIGAGYTYFRDGDVVVAKITPCFENGKGALAAGLANGIAFGTTELCVLRAAAALDQRFLFYLTTSHAFRRLGAAEMYGAGGQKRVPDSFVENLRHPLPPMQEQRCVAAFLERETTRIDGLVAKKERLIQLLQEKRIALISRAVTRGLGPSVSMKNSGVEWLGQIPAHWATKRLSQVIVDLMDFRGRTPAKLGMEWGGDIPAVSAVNVRDGHVDLDRGVNYGSPDLFDRWMTKGPTRKGDVLFTTEAPLGNTALVPDNERYILSQRVVLFRPRPTELTGQYLQRFLSSAAFRVAVEGMSTGSTAEGIKRRHLMAMFVAVPPIEEQHEISHVLDRESERIDGLVAKVRNAIERLKEFRSALISATVTGKIDVREEVM